jgi:hypothetical protein
MKKHWLSILIAGLLLLSATAIPILAAIIPNPTIINSTLDIYTGVNFPPVRNEFNAVGRHWVFYAEYEPFNPAEFQYATSTSAEAAMYTTIEVKLNTNNFSWETACWYDEPSNTVHYVRVSTGTGAGGKDQIMYNMGTPLADGNITWIGTEQAIVTTLDTNVVPINHQVAICCDEQGYPWIAFIDDTGIADFGLVYVMSSSTKNGTFTPDVTDDFTTGANDDAKVVSISPLAATGDIINVGWSSLVGAQTELDAVIYNEGTSWGGIQIVAVAGSMHNAYNYAFSFYDLGEDSWVAYTNNAGNVLVRERDAADTWAISAAAVPIKAEGLFHVPTLSGYGSNMICIISDAVGVLYSIRNTATGTWGSWNLIWQVTDPADIVQYHNAAYKTYSPLNFSWQVLDDSSIRIPKEVNLFTWWIDSDNNILGYYASTSTGTDTGNTLLETILPIILALAVILATLKFDESSEKILIAVILGLLTYLIVNAILAFL